jgi:hypothetical protein
MCWSRASVKEAYRPVYRDGATVSKLPVCQRRRTLDLKGMLR